MPKQRISRHNVVTAFLILATAETTLLFAFRYYKLMRVNQISRDISFFHRVPIFINQDGVTKKIKYPHM